MLPFTSLRTYWFVLKRQKEIVVELFCQYVYLPLTIDFMLGPVLYPIVCNLLNLKSRVHWAEYQNSLRNSVT